MYLQPNLALKYCSAIIVSSVKLIGVMKSFLNPSQFSQFKTIDNKTKHRTEQYPKKYKLIKLFNDIVILYIGSEN